MRGRWMSNVAVAANCLSVFSFSEYLASAAQPHPIVHLFSPSQSLWHRQLNHIAALAPLHGIAASCSEHAHRIKRARCSISHGASFCSPITQQDLPVLLLSSARLPLSRHELQQVWLDRKRPHGGGTLHEMGAPCMASSTRIQQHQVLDYRSILRIMTIRANSGIPSGDHIFPQYGFAGGQSFLNGEQYQMPNGERRCCCFATDLLPDLLPACWCVPQECCHILFKDAL